MTRQMGMRRWAPRGMVVALATGFIAVLAAATAIAQSTDIATHTTLATETQVISGRSIKTYSATVLGEDGVPATGVVALVEQGRSLASAALNSSGKAEILFDGLAAGDHVLRIEYRGDAAHASSESEGLVVHSEATTTAVPDFSLNIVPTTLPTLAPGASATGTATITSVNQFTGFVSLSCAGPPVSPGSVTDSAMPVGVTCTFTPTNLQLTSAIAASSNPVLTSDLTVQTTAPAGQNGQNRSPAGIIGHETGKPLVLAVLIPGVFGLGLLGRKRKVFGRAALLLLVGAVSLLGTTSCAARYKYLNHPPTPNDGTPPGAYTLTIWAQTSNGVTATEHFTTLALTVK